MTPTNKDLLALHNGAWNNSCPGANNSAAEYRDGMFVGQDKIVRVFSELMRNMAKMKTFIRPAMCKPYGKQSESLQKSKWLRSDCNSEIISLVTVFFRSPGHDPAGAIAAKLSAGLAHSRQFVEERRSSISTGSGGKL